MKVVALILGGGQGKRLFPLTMYRSKPAVPIGGKYRLIDIPVSNCLHSNIKDIYVLTQFNSESLNNHINNTYRFDYFSRAFVRILAAEQTLDNINWFEGTADAVRKNLLHLNLAGDEDVLVLSGDHLYEMNYLDLIHFHRKSKADFTVSVIPVSKAEISEFGILKLGSGSRITGFREKPRKESELMDFRPPYLASMGVYVFKAKVLMKVLESNDTDFGREIIPHSIGRFNGYGYIFNGYWKDVGTIKSFYDVNIDMASYKPHFSFFYEGAVFTRPRFLPTARIARSDIENSLIAEGSIITDAEIKKSVVGLRTIIGRNCRIVKTIIMGADYYEDPDSRAPVKIGIGNSSTIQNAILDKNVRVGRNVIIKNFKNLHNLDGANYFIRDRIVIIPKNAVLKDGTRI